MKLKFCSKKMNWRVFVFVKVLSAWLSQQLFVAVSSFFIILSVVILVSGGLETFLQNFFFGSTDPRLCFRFVSFFLLLIILAGS